MSFLWGPKAGSSFFGTLTARTIENSHDARVKSCSGAVAIERDSGVGDLVPLQLVWTGHSLREPLEMDREQRGSHRQPPCHC